MRNKFDFPRVFLGMMILIILNACTIQKRIHNKGYYVHSRKSNTSLSFESKKQKQEKIDEISVLVENHTDPPILEIEDGTSKSYKRIEKIVDFTEQINEKITEIEPIVTASKVAAKKNEMLSQIPVKQNQLLKKTEKQKKIVSGFLKFASSLVIILTLLALLIFLIPAIILTVAAKKNASDESKASKLWIGAWVCWCLIFLLFLFFVFLIIASAIV